MTTLKINENIQKEAQRLGFDLFGITNSKKVEDINFYQSWVSNGYAADMEYLKRNIDKREDPEVLLPGTKSIICLGLNYNRKINFNDFKIAKYALSDDYHTFLKNKIKELFEYIKTIYPNVQGRDYTDTAPILERSLARRAGLGWIGKNAMLINPLKGSYFLLGELFLDIDLVPNQNPVKNLCGNCTRCIDACPTDALISPSELNSNLCISYLTIESKKEIPEELTNKMSGYIFGCDICQDVCPWNKKFAYESNFSETIPREWINNKSLVDLINMEQEEFSKTFKNSPIKRSKLKGLVRNVVAMISKTENSEYIPILENIKDKHNDIVSTQVEWAIKKIISKNL